MSGTESQNGSVTASAPGNNSLPHSNGVQAVKSSVLSSLTTSTTTARAATNSSFLYSSNSLLGNRMATSNSTTENKARAPTQPPMPKYTSSFNSGTNGTGSAIDRLAKERDMGGSYRLASLERLAHKQRLFDGDKTNGDANSVRTVFRLCMV